MEANCEFKRRRRTEAEESEEREGAVVVARRAKEGGGAVGGGADGGVESLNEVDADLVNVLARDGDFVGAAEREVEADVVSPVHAAGMFVEDFAGVAADRGGSENFKSKAASR